jgi:hypothetical protein
MSRLNDLMHAYCPDGVGFQPLGKLTTIRNGFTYNADKVMTRPYKVSRIETISSGRINMDRVATVDSVNQSYKLQEGDILFSHINSIQYLGNCAYYTESIGELYHGMNLLNIHSINPDELLPRFLFYYMRTYQWWLNIYRDAKHAVNQVQPVHFGYEEVACSCAAHRGAAGGRARARLVPGARRDAERGAGDTGEATGALQAWVYLRHSVLSDGTSWFDCTLLEGSNR